MEKAADVEDIRIIKELFGSRARTLINALLSFDAYFNWYYPLVDSPPFMCDDVAIVENRAFQNMCSAIDMQESFERVSICNHKSFLPHGAVYKLTRDFLNIANPWAVDSSPLELQNADTKRTADKIGARRLELTKSGTHKRIGPGEGKQGPSNLVKVSAYSTTTAISTMRNLLGMRSLKRGDGLCSYPETRRNERIFGVTGKGRSKTLSSGVKLENLGKDYSPREDTCLKAFVRMCAARASDIASAETNSD